LSFYPSDSAITGLRIGAEEYTCAVSDALFEAGIYAPAMTYPVVARGEARLRIQVSAAHTDGDLDQVAQTISRCIGQASS
jgi:glycine C-acetyltransferase